MRSRVLKAKLESIERQIVFSFIEFKLYFNHLFIAEEVMYSLDDVIDCDDSSVDTLHQSIDMSNICYLCLSSGEGRCGATVYYSNDHSIHVIEEVEDKDMDAVMAILIQTEPNHVIIDSKSQQNFIQFLKSCAKDSDNEFDKDFDNEFDNDFDDNQMSETFEENLLTSDSAKDSRIWSTYQSMQRPIQTPEDSVQTYEETIQRPEDSVQTHEETIERPKDSIHTRTDSEFLWRTENRFKLHIVSHNLFAFENSKTRILSIEMTNDRNFANETLKFLYISSKIHFSDNNTFRSFGALLRFLDTNCIDIQMQTNRSTVEISSISRLYLQQMVSIDRNTYESLQIFQQEWHPSAAKQGSNQKEGLSLYGLFNSCVSKIGSNYLRKVFLQPTQEFDILNDRLNAIEFFVEPNNDDLKSNLNQHLKAIKSVDALFNRLKTSRFSVMDLKTIYNNLINGLRIRDLIVRQRTHLQIFHQIVDTFTEDLDRLAHIINSVVDIDRSFKSQTFEIKLGIDEELDSAKCVFTYLPQLLEETAKQEFQTYGSVLGSCNCVYIPQIGFLTTSRVEEYGSPDSNRAHGLEFVLRAGDHVYYKTFKTKELDEQFGDIQPEIIDRQMQIINGLEDIIFNKKHSFVSIVKCCAKLDAIIAMAQTAINYRYSRPNITSDGVIEIINGRHPLIELMSKAFVPNDYKSGEPYSKVKIISGPNACGKSVYLKQICLIVFMAHIGSYVPALTANISIIDRIFTRIHTPESISLRLSTFMLDLNQMSNATKNATKRSLVVVDEFGKGTQSLDGLALMAASVNHWLTSNTPYLIICTHFRSLPSLLVSNNGFDCQTFQFFRDDNQMTYLFKLIEGHFNESIASYIAYLANIPLEVIERGLQITQSMTTKKAIKRVTKMDQKFKEYEEIAENFLNLNIESEEEIKEFFETHFITNGTTSDSNKPSNIS